MLTYIDCNVNCSTTTSLEHVIKHWKQLFSSCLSSSGSLVFKNLETKSSPITLRSSAPHSQAMSTTVTPEMNLNYQDILQLTGDNKIILIDVREPKELQDNGVLPNSVNIPLGTVKEALQSSSQSFEDQYGIPLPDKNAPIVFSCHAGGRSMKALLAALEMGYKNARHYAGGFSDWKKNTENPQ